MNEYEGKIGRPWRGYYLTAYGIAVKHGFQGSEEEWLESLKAKVELQYRDGTLQWRGRDTEEWHELTEFAALWQEMQAQTAAMGQAIEDEEAARGALESRIEDFDAWYQVQQGKAGEIDETHETVQQLAAALSELLDGNGIGEIAIAQVQNELLRRIAYLENNLFEGLAEAVRVDFALDGQNVNVLSGWVNPALGILSC